MKTLKFKTNINCNACVSKVKPYLDNIENIANWEVETANPEKILTVTGDGIKAEQVVEKVKQAGYRIEEKKGFLGSLFK